MSSETIPFQSRRFSRIKNPISETENSILGSPKNDPPKSHYSNKFTKIFPFVQSAFQAFDTSSEHADYIILTNPSIRKSFDNKRHSVIVVVGKHIDLESYTLRGYNSKSLTGALGWLNLLTINEDFYLILVRSLYVAIDTSTSDEILFATIKGIIITLTPKIMS